ncbi:hypothetical protein KI387_000204, partial [Taxus chinensis]
SGGRFTRPFGDIPGIDWGLIGPDTSTGAGGTTTGTETRSQFTGRSRAGSRRV